jgi:hypothetical protein
MDDWLSYHLYYYEDLSRAVLGFVHPAVSSLLSAGWIDRFFFVRYGLGGPHVRLRLRPVPGQAPLINRAVRSSAEAFLSRSPSTARLDPEALQRQTQAMLGGDPHETDATVYPDNTLIARPFRPEVARYGGPGLLPVSLDFFTVSSAAAIDFLVRSGAEPRSRQLILALRLLLAQALCFAIDEEELLTLLGYGVESWGEAAPSILAKGDRVFATQPDAFCGIFRQEISDQLAEGSSEGLGEILGEAARLLSQAVGREDRPTRKRIGVSQLHMTATRLGLGNLEEVYISRLLSVAAAALLEDDPEARALLGDALDRPARSSSLEDLLPRVLAALPAWGAVDSAA